RPGVLGLAREALLQRLLERPQQRLGHHAVVADLDAELAMTDAEQLERRRQPVVMVEREDAELQRGHEFPPLRLGASGEAGAEGRVEPVELEEEQLADQVESRLERLHALANETLLLCRE